MKHRNLDKLTREALMELVDVIYVHEGGERTVHFRFADAFEQTSDEWLNYQIKGQEILLACEVEELCQALTELLTDQIKRECTIELIEPDLIFN